MTVAAVALLVSQVLKNRLQGKSSGVGSYVEEYESEYEDEYEQGLLPAFIEMVGEKTKEVYLR